MQIIQNRLDRFINYNKYFATESPSTIFRKNSEKVYLMKENERI